MAGSSVRPQPNIFETLCWERGTEVTFARHHGVAERKKLVEFGVLFRAGTNVYEGKVRREPGLLSPWPISPRTRGNIGKLEVQDIGHGNRIFVEQGTMDRVRTSTMNALRGEREVRSPIKDKDPPRVPNWCPSQSTNKTGEAWSTGNATMSDASVVQKVKVDVMSADMLISGNVEHRCWRHVESSVEVEEEKNQAFRPSLLPLNPRTTALKTNRVLAGALGLSVWTDIGVGAVYAKIGAEYNGYSFSCKWFSHCQERFPSRGGDESLAYSNIFEYNKSFNFTYPAAIRLNVRASKPISRHRKLTQVPGGFIDELQGGDVATEALKECQAVTTKANIFEVQSAEIFEKASKTCAVEEAVLGHHLAGAGTNGAPGITGGLSRQQLPAPLYHQN
ncbi:hypothetical protein DFH08DRAFT_828273 [Mycena albidolilacea]|uniref:Uncharacterized protein n=1 Tax=Mycena albidolilacea TaxID=1033008 RepID=A0AAD6YWD1_9AGAR|nr:hypothetical protein DFH08DRAFT_828273 [Mycena albidolilacea]